MNWYMKRVYPPSGIPERVHEKGEAVSTLDEWKAVLEHDLLELQQLEGQDASIRMRRSLEGTGNRATLLSGRRKS